MTEAEFGQTLHLYCSVLFQNGALHTFVIMQFLLPDECSPVLFCGGGIPAEFTELSPVAGDVGACPEQCRSRLEMHLLTAPCFVNALEAYLSLGTVSKWRKEAFPWNAAADAQDACCSPSLSRVISALWIL